MAKQTKKPVKKTKPKKYVVQIREVLDNKKFNDSVTKYINSKKAKQIYKILEE